MYSVHDSVFQTDDEFRGSVSRPSAGSRIGAYVLSSLICLLHTTRSFRSSPDSVIFDVMNRLAVVALTDILGLFSI